jgi:hypothetical protein
MNGIQFMRSDVIMLAAGAVGVGAGVGSYLLTEAANRPGSGGLERVWAYVGLPAVSIVSMSKMVNAGPVGEALFGAVALGVSGGVIASTVNTIV